MSSEAGKYPTCPIWSLWFYFFIVVTISFICIRLLHLFKKHLKTTKEHFYGTNTLTCSGSTCRIECTGTFEQISNIKFSDNASVIVNNSLPTFNNEPDAKNYCYANSKCTGYFKRNGESVYTPIYIYDFTNSIENALDLDNTTYRNVEVQYVEVQYGEDRSTAGTFYVKSNLKSRFKKVAEIQYFHSYMQPVTNVNIDNRYIKAIGATSEIAKRMCNLYSKCIGTIEDGPLTYMIFEKNSSSVPNTISQIDDLNVNYDNLKSDGRVVVT